MLPVVMPRRVRSAPVGGAPFRDHFASHDDEVPSPRNPRTSPPPLITAEEQEFRRRYPDYGFFRKADCRGKETIDTLFDREYSHLRGRHYLDAAGAAPTPASAQHAVGQVARLGNPHSLHSAGAQTQRLVSAARDTTVRRLLHGSTDEFGCVFTSGATASLKLVGEAFPWSASSVLVLDGAAHDSARGVGNLARARGATVVEIDLTRPMEAVAAAREAAGDNDGTPHLLLLSAECNFDGARHDVYAWGQRARAGKLGRGQWHVCVDAAKLLSTSTLQLSHADAPDMVTLSFYKIVGAPTGVGALVIRRSLIPIFSRGKLYTGGGSFAATAAAERSESSDKPRRSATDAKRAASRLASPELLEDGTLAFQQICALETSVPNFLALGYTEVGMHTAALRRWTVERLTELTLPDGSLAIILYGAGAHASLAATGPIVAFNVLSEGGGVLSISKVGHLAARASIDLRWGTFCNRGAVRRALCEHHAEAPELLDPCWVPSDTGRDGELTGALRVSFCAASRFCDARALVSFLAQLVRSTREGRKAMADSSSQGKAARKGGKEARKEGKAARKRKAEERGWWVPTDEDAGPPKATCTRRGGGQCSMAGSGSLGGREGEGAEGGREGEGAEGEAATEDGDGSGQGGLPEWVPSYLERRDAGVRFESAFHAAAVGSVAGVAWHLHDRRGEVDEEHEMTAFGTERVMRTALMRAAGQGHDAVVTLLLQVFGANVNHSSSTDGDSALHRAACNGRPQVVASLLEAGADPSARINAGPMDGWTAIRVARWKESLDREAHCCATRANYHPVVERPHDFAAAATELERAMHTASGERDHLSTI